MRPDGVRALVPRDLELDLFQGDAWIGMTAFRVSWMRPTLLPALPLLSAAHQVNVRTYVRRDGIPGLWFLSLDISNRLAVWGTRLLYRLPAHHARMHVEAHERQVSFLSLRRAAGRSVTFEARWQLDASVFSAEPGTLEHFLIERYWLYGGGGRRLRARIAHRRWPLCKAGLLRLESTLLSSHGLAAKHDAPLVHAQAVPFDVEIYRPERVT